MEKFSSTNKKLLEWVNKIAKLCKPERIVWIDGSEEQKLHLEKECVQSGELIRLNPEKLPGCFLHRTAQDDVARTEHLTFICTKKKHDAGPNNNWMSPAAAYRKAKEIFNHKIIYCKNALDALKDCQALVICADWRQFNKTKPEVMK